MDSEKKWPSEVFLPVFKRVEQRFGRRKITSRRIAKITKGVLAAQAALEYSISGGDSGEDLPLLREHIRQE